MAIVLEFNLLKNKTMKKLFLFAATVCTMLSCSKNEEVIPNEGKLPINISVGQQTRANDTTFENGDEVGIYVVNYDGSTAGTLKDEGNQADNAKFTYNSSEWTPDEDIYWKDQNTSADFYAYYPYSASTNVAAHTFSVQTNQSQETDFWASDFLWGKTANVSPTSNAVSIQTNHSLSRVLIDVKPGKGFDDVTWAAAEKSIKICNVLTSATINLATGVATATGNKGEITPLATGTTGSTLSYKAMMIPQTVADNSKLIVVTVDGTNYIYRTGFTFKANTQHQFTITVNKSGSSVDVTIGEWAIDDTNNVGDAKTENEANYQIIYDSKIKYSGSHWTTDTFGANIESHEMTTHNSYYPVYTITFDNPVTTIGVEAFAPIDGNELIAISIPNSVTTIEKKAFYGCVHMIGILSGGDNVKSIGEEAFAECWVMQIFLLPNSLETIGDKAFYNCSGVEEITIPSNVTSIGANAFALDLGNHNRNFYCKATTPPSLGDNALGQPYTIEGKSYFKIYVPANSVNAYKEADDWKQYAEYIFPEE